MLALLSRIGLSRIRQLFVAKTLSPLSRGANCRRDRDGYRPDKLGGGIGQARFLFGIMRTREQSTT